MPAWLKRFLDSLLPPPQKPASVPPPVTLGSDAALYLSLLNAERARFKRPPMQIDPKLTDLAQAWAEKMAAANILSHGDFAGRMRSVYSNSAAAENIDQAWTGKPSTVKDAFDAWRNSAPHYANMMGDYAFTGLGKATSKSGTDFWCADYRR